MAKRHLDEVDNYDYLASNSNLPEVVVTAPRKRNILQEWWDDISNYNFGKDIKDIFKDTPDVRHMVADLQNFGIIPEGSKDKNYSYGVMPMIDSPIGFSTKTTLKGISNTKSKVNFKQWVPEQWTAAQDAAIARGDMAEAQRLRDLHFRTYAPNTKIVDAKGNPQHVYHGGAKNITRFLNPNEFDANIKLNNYYKDGKNRVGIYTSDWKSYAEQYARGYKKKNRNIYDLYANIENPRYVSYWESQLNRLRNLNPFRKKDSLNPSIIRPEHKEELLKGYDGVKWDIENVVFDGKQLKSADAVTYDNNGVRIPLGKRDNFNINDIRYAFIPSLLGGVTAGYLYNNNNNYKFGGRRSLKSGGTIYIKPENRGKFNATKERTGKTTEELTHSKNPLTRKRAIFAQNAAKWKH